MPYGRGTRRSIAYFGSCAARNASASSAAGVPPFKDPHAHVMGSGDVMCHPSLKIPL